MTSEDTLAVIRSQITHSAPVADLTERADAIDARADIIDALVDVLTGRADVNDTDVDALQTWAAGVATQIISIGVSIATQAAALAALMKFRSSTVSLAQMGISNTDVPILWATPLPDATYGVTALIEGSPTAISNLTPGVKASSRTTVGCTITVNNSGLLPVAAGAQLHVLGWHT